MSDLSRPSLKQGKTVLLVICVLVGIVVITVSFVHRPAPHSIPLIDKKLSISNDSTTTGSPPPIHSKPTETWKVGEDEIGTSSGRPNDLTENDQNEMDSNQVEDKYNSVPPSETQKHSRSKRGSSQVKNYESINGQMEWHRDGGMEDQLTEDSVEELASKIEDMVSRELEFDAPTTPGSLEDATTFKSRNSYQTRLPVDDGDSYDNENDKEVTVHPSPNFKGKSKSKNQLDLVNTDKLPQQKARRINRKNEDNGRTKKISKIENEHIKDKSVHDMMYKFKESEDTSFLDGKLKNFRKSRKRVVESSIEEELTKRLEGAPKYHYRYSLVDEPKTSISSEIAKILSTSTELEHDTYQRLDLVSRKPKPGLGKREKVDEQRGSIKNQTAKRRLKENLSPFLGDETRTENTREDSTADKKDPKTQGNNVPQSGMNFRPKGRSIGSPGADTQVKPALSPKPLKLDVADFPNMIDMSGDFISKPSKGEFPIGGGPVNSDRKIGVVGVPKYQYEISTFPVDKREISYIKSTDQGDSRKKVRRKFRAQSSTTDETMEYIQNNTKGEFSTQSSATAIPITESANGVLYSTTLFSQKILGREEDAESQHLTGTQGVDVVQTTLKNVEEAPTTISSEEESNTLKYKLIKSTTENPEDLSTHVSQSTGKVPIETTTREMFEDIITVTTAANDLGEPMTETTSNLEIDSEQKLPEQNKLNDLSQTDVVNTSEENAVTRPQEDDREQPLMKFGQNTGKTKVIFRNSKLESESTTRRLLSLDSILSSKHFIEMLAKSEKYKLKHPHSSYSRGVNNTSGESKIVGGVLPKDLGDSQVKSKDKASTNLVKDQDNETSLPPTPLERKEDSSKRESPEGQLVNIETFPQQQAKSGQMNTEDSPRIQETSEETSETNEVTKVTTSRGIDNEQVQPEQVSLKQVQNELPISSQTPESTTRVDVVTGKPVNPSADKLEQPKLNLEQTLRTVDNSGSITTSEGVTNVHNISSLGPVASKSLIDMLAKSENMRGQGFSTNSESKPDDGVSKYVYESQAKSNEKPSTSARKEEQSIFMVKFTNVKYIQSKSEDSAIEPKSQTDFLPYKPMSTRLTTVPPAGDRESSRVLGFGQPWPRTGSLRLRQAAMDHERMLDKVWDRRPSGRFSGQDGFKSDSPSATLSPWQNTGGGGLNARMPKMSQYQMRSFPLNFRFGRR